MKRPLILPILAALVATANMADAQTLSNGSFDQGSTVTYSSTDLTAQVSVGGWTVNRNQIWNYDWNGNNAGGQQTQRVMVFNGSSGENPYGYDINGQPVDNGSGTGSLAYPANGPADAQNGGMYLGIYNGFYSHETNQYFSDYNGNSRPVQSNTKISNTITGLTSGSTYRVDYYYAGIGETGQGAFDIDLRARIGSTVYNTHSVMDFTNTPVHGPGTGLWKKYSTSGASTITTFSEWTKGSFTFTADSASAALNFVGLMQGGPALLQLDNVSVTQVPEASTSLLCIAGVSLAVLRRRRPMATQG